MSIIVTNIFTGARRSLNTGSDLVAPWCLDLCRREFVELKIFSLMQKVFTDCYRYSTKIIDKDKENSLFDSLIYRKPQYGLISRLAYMIANEKRMYLVYDHGIIREATFDEQIKIDADYSKGMTYTYGIILDFSKYAIGKLLAHYFHQIYTIEQATNNSISLGGSLQYKVKDLRAKIGYEEGKSSEVREQAAQVTRHARDGKPIVIDKEDELDQTDASNNITTADSSRDRCYRELAAALGGPVSYITGIDDATTGSGYSYERLDSRAEDMIKNFWMTVFEPVVSSLLQTKIEFVSQKWMTIKENLGSISLVEGLECIPVAIKASVIKKLIGDNHSDKTDEVENEIMALLKKQAKAKENMTNDFIDGGGDEDE